jgi:NitT/TauT family transport system permease protein
MRKLVMSKKFQNLIFYVFLVAIWQIIFSLKIWPEYIFPSPVDVLRKLVNGFSNKTFYVAIMVSMRRIFLGYGISLVAGILLGIMLGSVKFLDGVVGPPLFGLRTLPRMIIFVVVMGATFSITLATDDGVKNISPIYLKAASTMGATGLRRYSHVILPAALPSIVTGMKLGWSFAWRSLMAGEMLFVSLGLGHLLMMGRELNDLSQVMAVMGLILAIGIMVDRLLFGNLEKRVRERWGLDKS